MKVPRIHALLIPILFAHVAPSALSGDKTEDGSSILEQGRIVMRAAGSQPLRQSGKLIAFKGSKPMEGIYAYANNGTLSRDEIVIAGYREIRIRSGNSEKIQRSLSSPPLAVYEAFEAVRAGKWLQLGLEDRIKRVSNHKVAKLPTKCVEVESKNTDRSLCFYEDGTLAAMYTGTGWNYEYSEYSAYENSRLPGKIRVLENGLPVTEIQMETPQHLDQADDIRDDINHPTLTLGWCEGITPPVVINKVPPHYPVLARQNLTQGTVDLYGIVAADGRIQGLGIVRTAGAALDKSSAEAVSQWMYRPAMCGTVPVAMETVVSVHYTLSW